MCACQLVLVSREAALLSLAAEALYELIHARVGAAARPGSG
jgi:hypothetical protein